MDLQKVLAYIPDEYTRKARLYPVLIVALPLIVLAAALFPDGIPGGKMLSSLFMLCGGSMLFAQVGRDLGKRKEPWLFDLWGGKPTTRMLRHRDASNTEQLSVRHEALAHLCTPVRIPTAEEERVDSMRADKIYETCVGMLIERTRDKEKFHLLFEENCNYGFRRNLWGMKPLGITVSVVRLCVIVILGLSMSLAADRQVTPDLYVYGIMSAIMLLMWIRWITPQWVRVPGDAYAERLLGTIEVLERHTVRRERTQ